MDKTHSLCITNWNSIHTVREWAESLLANLSEEDEVIIVDGRSTDGSQKFLEGFCQKNGFNFISAKTNIGEARQLASEHATGQYIISQLDTDDIIVSLRETKKLYHEVVELDPPTGMQRAFWGVGFFIIPRAMLAEVGGYPNLHYYEDQLVAFRLADRGRLTASWQVSSVARGKDPKKRKVGFRMIYSFRRIRDGLRLGFLKARNLQSIFLVPPAWIASLFLEHYDFRHDWWNLDVHRDDLILAWVKKNDLSHKLLIDSISGSLSTTSIASEFA